MRSRQASEHDSANTSSNGATAHIPAVPIMSAADLAALHLMQSFAAPGSHREPLPPLLDFANDPQLATSDFEALHSIDWSNLELEQPEWSGSTEVERMQAINDYMLDIYENGPDNINLDDEPDDEHPDSSDAESDLEYSPMRGLDAFDPYNGLLNKRPRMDLSQKSPEWFPWPNRTSCTLDILMHLPHSVFSVRQLDLFLWLLKVNGTQDATSVKTMKDLDTKLQSLYGIQTYEYKGAFRHTYYVNSIADIISQEMSNPCVRPHLSFYPEDAPSNLTDARQFSRWLKEIPDDELGPMAHIGTEDYFIFEPAMLRSGLEEAVWDDHRTSWHVIQGGGRFEVDQDQFLKSFPVLMSDLANGLYPHLTDVSNIEDFIDKSTNPPIFGQWKLTNPVLGNPWRQKANGAKCLSFPIWLYCNDTSGNTSKHWNEHNSFLFTPAGLPRSESSKEYNVHFLSTLNSAPPLEMLDGKDAAADHACKSAAPAQHVSHNSDGVSDESETGSVGSASTNASKGGQKKKRMQYKESLASMVNQVKQFVKVTWKTSKQRGKHYSLKTQFLEAETLGGLTRIKAKHTETGLKDTYQSFFMNRLLDSYKRHRGLDPHSDTPVKILHVVLLGFIKYLWRDVIENQIKKNPEKKKELATRLSSVDVEGLGLGSKLAGDTLMNYYGSLTGLDFHKIGQVSPFVLKSFVSDECYQTWVSLLKLVPLIWQPEIENLETHIETLKDKIQQFLLHAGKWSIQWFNKPKFHILVHLPEHIRRFGPAMLFATEVFESYNAIICAKSIHSNRLAPSRDIAWAFAKQNRIHHLLSGGIFLDREQIKVDSEASKKFKDPNLPQTEHITQHWVCIGQSAMDVVSWSSDTVGQYLGISDKANEIIPTGACTLDPKSSEQRWANTQTGRITPNTSNFTETEKMVGSFHRAQDMILSNGDKCRMLTYAACSHPALQNFSRNGIAIAQVVETLRLKRSGGFTSSIADSVLVEAVMVRTTSSSHGMPRLMPSSQYFALKPGDLCCTVNVQHDCDQNSCVIENVLPVYQEQKKTSQLKGAVVHKGNLQDKVLNTAQMRDAKYVQKFCIKAVPLSLDHVLEESATREWNAQNRSKAISGQTANTGQHPRSTSTSARSWALSVIPHSPIQRQSSHPSNTVTFPNSPIQPAFMQQQRQSLPPHHIWPTSNPPQYFDNMHHQIPQMHPHPHSHPSQYGERTHPMQMHPHPHSHPSQYSERTHPMGYPSQAMPHPSLHPSQYQQSTHAMGYPTSQAMQNYTRSRLNNRMSEDSDNQ
ncbi:hypothetical protein BT96DRAFT_993265 [Gymnopus androsaceus JB14]|uniref:Uncharacterized protein n=1 Tax=Gymnopus androsaceus JB14 TaxID=1447944 RepID=A0A6A4HR71_9AGAR|nr:hypothetical protein BT96DRAFT_993265 [Gymnopus androsaceus JB14]